MNTSSKITMMLSLLTRGWIGRIFVLLLWALIIALYFLSYSDVIEAESVITKASIMLFFANMFFYFIIVAHLPSIIQSQMAALLPNYFQKLRSALFLLLFISFSPALILLTKAGVVEWLSLLTVLLLLAMLIMVMIFQAKYYFIFILLMFIPVNFVEYLSKVISLGNNLLAFVFPFLLVYSYHMLGKLESLRGKTMYFSQFLSMSSFSLTKAQAEQEITAPKSKNIFTKWLVKSNSAHSLNLIGFEGYLSKRKLLGIACQGNTVIGRGTYAFWAAMVIFICVIAGFLDETYHHYFIPMMIIFPSMIIGTGTMTMFQSLLNKKSYLTRISITPIFAIKNSFASAFMSFIIFEQIKLYLFTSIVITLFAYITQHLTLTVFMNIMLLAISITLINVALMLLGLGRKVAHNSLTMWLMFVVFIIYMTWLLVVVVGNVELKNSVEFLSYFSLCITLFFISFYRGYQRIPHWLA